jgi:predicted MFS family arabinose efflux permease
VPDAGSGDATPTARAFERRMVLLVGSLQFVSAMSLMMVAPLGPALSEALDVEPNHMGLIAGSFTGASALSGIISALFLDRFDRRRGLAVAMTGVVLGSVASALATDLTTLLAARIFAGLFGGPAGALSTSVLVDNIPVERRGRAMAAAMGSISIASIVGIPIGLQLALWGGWRLPFAALAAAGLMVAIGVLALLPPQRAHLVHMAQIREHAGRRLVRIAFKPASLLAFALGAAAQIPTVTMSVNMSVFVTLNLGMPMDDLRWVYVFSGVLSLIGMRFTGPMVDRFGATPAIITTSALSAVLIYVLYYDWEWLRLPAMLLVPMFMMVNMSRFVAQTATVSKVPSPADRAGFMAIYQSVQQVSSAFGALVSSALLGSSLDGKITHMPRLALLSLSMIVLGPVIMALLERQMRRDGPV